MQARLFSLEPEPPKPKPAKATKPKREPKRIPYEQWVNSQLSIARLYGGIQINGVEYRLDYDNARTEGPIGNVKYFPDLVEVVK